MYTPGGTCRGWLAIRYQPGLHYDILRPGRLDGWPAECHRVPPVHWAGEALIAETDTWESAEALDTSTAVLATSDTAIQFSGNPLDGNDVATASTTISNSGNPVSARPAWSTDAEDLNNEWPEDWPDEESNATE